MISNDQETAKDFNPAQLAYKVGQVASNAASTVTKAAINKLEQIISKNMGGSVTSASPKASYADRVNNIVAISDSSIQDLTSKLMPQQLNIADIAKETTQNKVVDGISSLGGIVENVMNPVGGLSFTAPDIVGSLMELKDATNTRLDDVVSKLQQVNKNTLLIDALRIAFKDYSKTLKGIWASSTDMLMENVDLVDTVKKDLNVQEKWFEYDRTRDMRGDTSHFDESMFDKNWKEKLYDMFLSPTVWMERYRVVVPEKGIIDRAMKSVQATSLLMGILGGAAGAVGVSLAKNSLKGSSKIIKSIFQLFGFFASNEPVFGEFLGPTDQRPILQRAMSRITAITDNIRFNIIGTLEKMGIFLMASSRLLIGLTGIGAVITALIAYPDQAAELLTSITDLFTKQLIPGLNYLFTDVLGPAVTTLSKNLMQWWNSGGQGSMQAVGYFINDVLIYFFGTVLPNALNFVSVAVTGFIDMTAEIYKRITGLFGIGDYGQEGILKNLNALPDAVGKYLLRLIGAAALTIAGLTGFEVDWTKGLWYNINVVVNTIAILVENAVTALVKGIGQAVADGLMALSEKIVKWIGDAIDKLNPYNWGSLTDPNFKQASRRRYTPELDSSENQTQMKELSDQYMKFLKEPPSSSTPNVIIQSVAPVNNTSNSTVVNGGGNGGGGGRELTKPTLSDWDQRVTSFGNAMQ